MDQNEVLQEEPPSRQSAQVFYIGRNSRGNWVVQDKHHTCGGLFIDRAEAVRFAMFENGRKRQAVIMVPETMELDLGGALMISAPPNHNSTFGGQIRKAS